MELTKRLLGRVGATWPLPNFAPTRERIIMLSLPELFHSIVEHTHWTEESDRLAAHAAVDEHFTDNPANNPKTDSPAESGDTTHE